MEQTRVSVAGTIPVDPETCFTDSRGRSKPRLEKQARGGLEKVAPLLGAVLEDGEVVRHVAAACSPYSILELLTTGWIIASVKRCMLVVTDRRILHIPLTASARPKRSISQVRFGDLRSAEVKGALGKELRLTYRDGTTEKFRAIKGAAARKLREVLGAQELGLFQPSAVGRRHHLCPRCSHGLERLAAEDPKCSACGLGFKSRRRAFLLSILLPGGGYFYTGHPVLGLFDALVEGMLLLFLLLSLVFAATGEPGFTYADAGIFAVLLAIEKLVTVYHASHYVQELQPAERSLRPAAGAALRA